MKLTTRLAKLGCTRGRPVNTRGGAYPGRSSSRSDRGSCSQGPTVSTPFIAPPALLHLQRRQWETSRDQRSGVEKSGRPFYCRSPRKEKGSVCAREMSGKGGGKISVYHDICTRMNILKSRDCILFKCWIWNPNISCLRYYPRATGYSHVFYLFFIFFCSMQQMRCKRRCLWEGRRTGCWVGEQGERSLGGLTLWYGALKRPLEGVQYQEQD